jgi:hypothetical protein
MKPPAFLPFTPKRSGTPALPPHVHNIFRQKQSYQTNNQTMLFKRNFSSYSYKKIKSELS